MATTLRVATLNIWNRSGPWPDRLPLIRRELQRLGPAVIGLQEVRGGRRTWPSDHFGLVSDVALAARDP
jgi:hypothetical protein